jgi:hypothetical protein
VWEGWKAGFMAFHAFHTPAFPWLFFGAARDLQLQSREGACQRCKIQAVRIRLVTALAIACAAISLAAQTDESARSRLTTAAQRKAEDQVAAQLERIRTSAKLPKLKRVKPSVVDLQLVCTAARTGKEVHDPRFGGLETYVTHDLSAETESLRLVALGTSQPADGSPRYPVYSDKTWSRYSITVQLDRSSKPDNPVYTVGVIRRQSAFGELIAPITYDHPIRDSKDWKNQVDPACSDLRP